VTDPDPKIDVEFVITEGPQDKVQTLNIVNSKGAVQQKLAWKAATASAGQALFTTLPR